jgi:hypothetical protein
MAGYAKLVCVWISEIRAVVVLVILGPQAWRSLGGATIGQRDRESLLDGHPALRKEGHHLAVATFVRKLVVGLADEKERPWTWLRLPTCPGTIRFAEASLDSEGCHQWIVEGQCALEIANANEDM